MRKLCCLYGNECMEMFACNIGRNTTPIGNHGNSFQEAHGGLIQYRSLSLWRPFLESSVFGGRKRRFSVDGWPNRRKQNAFSNLSRLGWMDLTDVTSTRSCFRTSCVKLFLRCLHSLRSIA